MRCLPILVVAALLASQGAALAAGSVMVQCGQQYQAAKAAGTLNGQSWGQYRTDCAARIKPETTAAAPAPAATPADLVPPQTSTSAAAPKPVSGGRAAMLVRQKQCGAEWRAQKATLIAQTPGLAWPKYWSQCNTRLKAAGQ